MADRVYPPVIAAARAMFATLGLHFLESGTENVPTSGGAVLVANHVSYLDFIFAGLAAHPSHRLVRFMAKESIFKHPIAGPLMRGMHHIPVDREAGASSYAAALRALRAGEIVGVFPEATISRAFELKDFKSGAVRLAMSSGVPRRLAGTKFAKYRSTFSDSSPHMGVRITPGSTALTRMSGP